jgi:hypothetical protein
MVGLGGIRPNTVAIGFYSDWMDRFTTTLLIWGEKSQNFYFLCLIFVLFFVRSEDDLSEYVDTIRDSMRHKFSMVVVRDHYEIFSNHKNTPIDIWWLADDGGMFSSSSTFLSGMIFLFDT